MAGISAHRLRERIAFLERNYVKGRLATEAEIAEVASRFRGQRSKDSLWEHWAHLHAMGLARMPDRDREEARAGITDKQLEAARDALLERPEIVELTSVGEFVPVFPASYSRILAIEEHAYWLATLTAAHRLLRHDHIAGNVHPGSPTKNCGECGRPLEAGNLADLLGRIRIEIRHQRGMMLSQVLAPGPGPAERPVPWNYEGKVTAVEEELLKQAYHKVNYHILVNLPRANEKEPDSKMPRDWSFFFSAMSREESKPARTVMRDRSLASTITTYVENHIRQELQRRESEMKRKTGEGQGGKKRAPRKRAKRARKAR